MMIRSAKRLCLVAIAALAANSAAHGAESAVSGFNETQTRMADAVHRYVIDSVLRVASPGESLRVLMIAQQYAIADACDGYEIDHEKLRTALSDVTSRLQALTEEGQKNLPVDIVLNGYSAAVGGHLAIAAYDQAAYCARAATLRELFKKEPDNRASIWKMAD